MHIGGIPGFLPEGSFRVEVSRIGMKKESEKNAIAFLGISVFLRR